MSRRAVLPLDAATYARHDLHGEGRAWVDKNCYIDIWIEVLHALGLDPMPLLPFTVALDFEGDQWTFYKPPHDEIWSLYGVDVQEMTVWKPLIEHVKHHLGAGKLVSTEADAFFLPDTNGTDYKMQHTKTTIVIQEIDVEARKLGYFHSAGYFGLEGADFDGLFRLGLPPDPSYMPFFAELIRIDRVVRRPAAELAAQSVGNLRRHLARRPQSNPVRRFAELFAAELPALQQAGLAHYHAWAFATIRQLGSAFELLALYLRWLGIQGEAGLEPAAAAFATVSDTAKSLILKGARAVNGKKPVDFGPLLAPAVDGWEQGMELLTARYRA